MLVVMLMFARMTMTAVAICESLMVIGNGRIGKIPKTGKTGHKIGEIYKMEGDIRVRGTVQGESKYQDKGLFSGTLLIIYTEN